MGTRYDQDIVAWANEQAALLREGRLNELDLKHIADEIEDVGKSEQRELASRMAVLMAHLLKWQFQLARQGKSWEVTIRTQRRQIERALAQTPSLRTRLSDAAWLQGVWDDAIDLATKETGLVFPEHCLWSMDDVLREGWLPA